MTSASHAEGRQFDPGQVYSHRTYCVWLCKICQCRTSIVVDRVMTLRSLIYIYIYIYIWRLLICCNPPPLLCGAHASRMCARSQLPHTSTLMVVARNRTSKHATSPDSSAPVCQLPDAKKKISRSWPRRPAFTICPQLTVPLAYPAM